MNPQITNEIDLLLAQTTVRLRDGVSLETIGTGFLYYTTLLNGNVYILTAAHVLFKDSDEFGESLEQVWIDIYDASTNTYHSLLHTINLSLINPVSDEDIAVLVVKEYQVKALIGNIPPLACLQQRGSVSNFIIKGFPMATRGQEIATIHPVWKQHMTEVHKFQLELKEDYKSSSMDGFSGSGAILYSSGQPYLYGLFTRYREEGKGKVIYCQYLDSFNKLLQKNYLPPITFTYLGEHGLNKAFFEKQNEDAISNLGPRYNAKLNFRLPIALLFNDLSRDHVFRQRLTAAIDRWLDKKRTSSDTIYLKEITTAYINFKTQIIDWLTSLQWDPDQKIEWQFIIDELIVLDQKIDTKKNELYELQWKERDQQTEEEKNKPGYRLPYNAELNDLREIEGNNDRLLSDLNDINLHLANHPCLLIKGEAGCGKSHLLGDITNERKRRGEPTLLLLGQRFKSGQTVWQNVLSQLSVSCSKDELLQTLNRIGKQMGMRVLLLIDALNEGAGKELWPNELSSFIQEIGRYPFVGLSMTIRSTYYNVIIPDNVQTDLLVTKKVHEGFKGNEYEALHLFCEHHGLEQPNFPILAPEYTNPLFLQLICEGVKNSEERKFPQGFQGATKIFHYYLQAVAKNLMKRREEYELKPGIVKKAIDEVAKRMMVKEGARELTTEEAWELFETKFPSYRYLLNDLIHENIFIQTTSTDYKSKQESDVLLFAFERLGDFIIAEELLKPFSTVGEVLDSFKEDQRLGKLLEQGWWYNRGLLEIMAVLLPEKFGLEITEVYNWAFEAQQRNQLGNIDDFLNRYLLDSLKWRTPESIDDKKISAWINGPHFSRDLHTLYNLVLQLTIIKNNPFNGDRFHHRLLRHKMPNRDSFLQEYFRFYSGYADDGTAYPIRRLIDWAWIPGISIKVDSETARLAGQTLAWVLSSTFGKLRDQTTKAMVNLLENQIEALIEILKAFNGVDDLYIQERLYAVAYGCALRTSNEGLLQRLAQFTYDNIFAEEKPPVHILLRDYARNVVEYALHKGLSLIGNMDLIRPPYNTPMPTHFPSEEELRKFLLKQDVTDHKTRYNRLHNRIHFSIMEWDFGNKTVDSGLREFSPFSFRMEARYKLFLKKLNKSQREEIRLYEKLIEVKTKIENKKYIRGLKPQQKMYEAAEGLLKEELKRIPQSLKKTLSAKDFSFFSETLVPYFGDKEKVKTDRWHSIDQRAIKRWMVNRAFSLGYDVTLHGKYDDSVDNYNNRAEYKIERIGKKYQWIAYHEALAMVADNYKIREESYTGKKYVFYKGPWQRYIRDIDPSYIGKNRNPKPNWDKEESRKVWWLDNTYDYWSGDDQAWLSRKDDLPDPRTIIQRTDEGGRDWLYLQMRQRWEQPTPVGQRKYHTQQKIITYTFQACLIKKKDRDKAINYVKRHKVDGSWMPHSHNANTGLINQENYWAPAARDRNQQRWENLIESKYKIMVATAEAVGEFAEDKSGAHHKYEMPCQLLFDAMRLRYAPIEGDFINKVEELVCTITPDGGTLIDKWHLQQFVKDSEYDIVWLLYGEKQALGWENDWIKNNDWKVISGIYYLEDGRMEGQLSFIEKNDE